MVKAYSDKVRFRARKQKQYEALRDLPAVTRDGVMVQLQMNAGLLADMPHLAESGGDGIGLFRTELMFMLSHNLPSLSSRRHRTGRCSSKPARNCGVPDTRLRRDKILPYLRQIPEENPAIGWRAVRMSLDRPALFRMQVRALIKAGAGRKLRIMIPMISVPWEIDDIRALIEKEMAIAEKRGRRASAAAAHWRHDRSAERVVRTRCAAAEGRFRLGGQQRPLVLVCGGPGQWPRGPAFRYVERRHASGFKILVEADAEAWRTVNALR